MISKLWNFIHFTTEKVWYMYFTKAIKLFEKTMEF